MIKNININDAEVSAELHGYMYLALYDYQGILHAGSRMTAEIVSNNEIKINDGILCNYGRFMRIVGSETVRIENGTSGMKRTDLIVARFNTNGTKETHTLAVIKGSAGGADPSYSKTDIYSGTGTRDLVLYAVHLNGLNITSVERKCQEYMSIRELTETVSKNVWSERKLIFIGDSYGDGYTPEGNATGWCDRLKNKLVNCHFSADNIYINHKGGANFCDSSNNYLNLIKGVEPQIGNKKMVTDVLIGGGYNEIYYKDKPDLIKSNIDNVISYVQSTYPNAIVHFAPFGVAFKDRHYQEAFRHDLMPIYISKSCYDNQPFVVVPDAENILSFENMMSSDGVHPNQWGLECIAEFLKGYILGTGSGVFEKRPLMVGLNGGTFTGWIFGKCCGDINLYRIVFNEQVNNLNSIGINGFKLYTPTRTNAFPWRAPTIGMQGTMAIIRANGAWYDVPVKFYISNENELYIQFKQINSTHDNYQSYSNITNIQLDAWIVAENM